MNWRVINSGILSVEEVMEKDAALLNQIDSDASPIIHFYEWKTGCLTYGYFTNPLQYLHEDRLKKWGLEMSRRPTGGGIIFHLSDLAFSTIVPSSHPFYSTNTLDCYRAINKRVASAVSECCPYSPDLFTCADDRQHKRSAFCMEQPTVYDLLMKGKKVGGAAQRKSKKGVLHQASLSLTIPPYDLIEEVLLSGKESVEKMRENSFYLFKEPLAEADSLEKRRRLQFALIAALSTKAR